MTVASRQHHILLTVIFLFLLIPSECPVNAGENNPEGTDEDTVQIGSKTFTESVLLGEILTQLVRSTGAKARHQKELGGTRVCWEALRQGQIDLYVEYTGTLTNEIFAGQNIESRPELRRALRKRNLKMSRPLGFENTYVLGMKASKARKLGIQSISDLKDHPDLRLGFTNEYMDREDDGWPALRSAYNLPHKNVRGLKHQIAYRALNQDRIDVTDLYSTDAKIRKYDLRKLKDDRNFFPDYHAVVLYRSDLKKQSPEVIPTIRKLEGTIDEDRMVNLNASVSIDRNPVSSVASTFLSNQFPELEIRGTTAPSFVERLTRTTIEHLKLVLISMAMALVVAVPLGIVSARKPTLGQGILGAVGIIQTVPALALLVFMLPFLPIGDKPAIAALFLYSLLPIVRNTYAGLNDIPPEIRESAVAVGLPPLTRLLRIELPVAARTILSGIKISAVINVGTATLGALIGAGGYGQPILTGIRLDDVGLILEGAIPASLLALLIQGLFEIIERLVIPRGLQDHSR